MSAGSRDYNSAVEILADLRDLIIRQDNQPKFRPRLTDVKEHHGRRSSLMEQVDKKGL